MREIATAEYWNTRVRESPDLKDMLFRDGRREEYWRRVREQLSFWKGEKVMDICCGYGQFADIFSDYYGVDISDEMLKLARQKHPEKTFVRADILGAQPSVKVDVVFEVNSLHSLGLTPAEFADMFPKTKIVACLECDVFTIFQRY